MKIALRGATLGYGSEPVSVDLDMEVPEGSVTMIVGPNGCGKSTALRALARLLQPRQGSVILDGGDIRELGTRELARRLGLLSQQATAPDGIRVSELVARGRYPHQGLLRRWSRDDERAVADAMRITGVAEFRDAPVDELSGGQRQRVWIAMALAQETKLLLLDEPTTFLDLAHQLDVLELCCTLAEREGRTIVAVVHDLSQAARYASHLIAMRGGEVVAAGPPRTVVTEALIREVFGVEARVSLDEASGAPVVMPLRTVRGPSHADDAVRASTAPRPVEGA